MVMNIMSAFFSILGSINLSRAKSISEHIKNIPNTSINANNGKRFERYC